MRTSTADSNKAHYAALEVVENAVRNGTPIRQFLTTINGKTVQLKVKKVNKASFKKVVN